MIIECGQCQAGYAGCGDCAVTTLLGTEEQEYHDLDLAEVRALHVLANAGMIPPLRYTPRFVTISALEPWPRSPDDHNCRNPVDALV
jgi:hypothetical protein